MILAREWGFDSPPAHKTFEKNPCKSMDCVSTEYRLTVVGVDLPDKIHKNPRTAAMTQRGAIGIEVYRGKLRVRIPSEYDQGKQQVIYTQQPDNEFGWRKARQLAWQIEDDIATGIFDSTLNKYKPTSQFTPLVAEQYSLLDIWGKYCEYRKPQISVTHYEVNYLKRYRNAIIELPTQALADGVIVRDHLLKTKTAGTAKQLLIQFNAACQWAVKSKLIISNPFQGMAVDIRNKRKQEEEIDPFSPKERDAIIEAFENHSHHKHYASFVKFLFLTGCRTSEAVGLRWNDINQDCTKVTFSSAITKRRRKGTKTGKSRKFPCGDSLKDLLASIKPTDAKPDDLVFPNPNGNPINPDNFMHNSWRGEQSKGKVGIVTKLVQEGKVERYRPQYNTRHTFITECLEAGVSVPQIARWVGNSAGTLLAHYGGVLKQMFPPEF